MSSLKMKKNQGINSMNLKMSDRTYIFKIIKEIEERWGCICYAYLDSNTPNTNIWWTICIDNYELYTSEEIKPWFDKYRNESNKRGIKILFCYCNPIESKLLELAKNDNLILNI